MKVSLLNSEMGAGLHLLNPFAFPSGRILNFVWDNTPTRAKSWNQDMIQDLYALYKSGIEKGLPIFKTGQTQITDYIQQNSNYDIVDIRLFLYALYKLAETGEISTKWYNPEVKIRKNIIESVAAVTGPAKSLNKTLVNIKWIGILALSGVALYYAYPFLKTIRRRIK